MNDNNQNSPNCKKIDCLINQYALQKTLCFSLIPSEKTLEHYQAKKFLETDEEIGKCYETVKTVIDRYLKNYNDKTLSNIKTLNGLKDYANLYLNSNDKEERAKLTEYAGNLRKEISAEFDSKKLFGKELIKEKIKPFIENDEERKAVERMSDYTTYFTGFFTNRKNMYDGEEKSVGIAYRCINDNLPKFLDNVKSFGKIKNVLSQSVWDEINENFQGVYGTKVNDVFTVDYFIFVLSQSGIENYNRLIGGYTNESKVKIKGINEYINAHNQNADKSDRLPLLKPLYKQILADSESASFIPAKLENDNEVLKAVFDMFNTDEVDGQTTMPSIKSAITQIQEIVSNLSDYSIDGIYVANGSPITEVSNKIFGSWSKFQDLWNEKYDAENKNTKIKSIEKYYENRKKAYKSVESISLNELQNLIESSDDKVLITGFFKDTINVLYAKIFETYSAVEPLLTEKYDSKNKGLKSDENSVALIKNFLDSLKAFEGFVKFLNGTGTEMNKDETFYGKFTPLFDRFKSLDKLYDRVRSYVTQKPYSTEKIKLNFGNSQFLDGWDRNKEKDYLSVLLIKDNKYYLAVIDKDNKKVFENISSEPSADNYKKMNYKLLPGPNKMLPKVLFSKKNIDFFAPSDEIMKIYSKGTFKKGKDFNIDDCHKLIDFYKESIEKHPDWKTFGFEFKDTNSYDDISKFYKDVENQGYKITYTDIPTSYINSLVDEGKIYLFRIYNKDFSEHSKGKPNLHTLYFKMLFDEENLKNPVYKLNGGAEMFYRPASIKADKPTHPKNVPITNKNPDSTKQTSTFEYDLIKDKRYTKPQFSLHLPITMNCQQAKSQWLNEQVRTLLKHCDNNYVIGIDRGERNLIYATVVDGKGKIVEQHSFNIIENNYNGTTHKTDYHSLLDKKETERQQARQNWTAIENIKELKEGYVSQVVHKICQLVVKYDAVIAMEDLNKGFKNSRIKVEKQVYQKFEKMLIDKLNYYVDKDKAKDENGGLMRAYQITNKFESFNKIGLQNGIIFYIPAWLTSKVDPVTGFVDLLKPKYKNEPTAKEFISKFDSIRYNSYENYFEFSFNYKNFERGTTDYRKQWIVCTNGERIRTFRDPKNNGEWSQETVNLVNEFKNLFDKHNISYADGKDLKEQILSQSGKEFFAGFIGLLALTLQMRNSKTNDKVDYLISPVKDKNGKFYFSNDYQDKDGNPLPDAALPADADANGAYNIARKVLWAIDNIKASSDSEIMKAKISIKNEEWLEYVQRQDMNE